MAKTTDKVALDDWHAIGRVDDVTPIRARRTRLLGQDIIAERAPAGAVSVFELDGDGGKSTEHAALDRYGHVWTTLGDPTRDMLDMPEFREQGRRLINCGMVTVRTSPLRIVENFLDMSHFPYVHTGVLGIEPETEVSDYDVEVRQPEDEIWATRCKFFQPQAAMSAEGGQMSDYMYRVGSPFVTVLYKTCPVVTGAWDLIGIFVQPREEDLCDVHTFMLLFDDTTSDVDLIHFQHMIFLQDRGILENQVPRLMPLDPRAEDAVKADATSMLYRRWLREKNLQFGTVRQAA